MDKNIKNTYNGTQIRRTCEQTGESLEEMIRRCTANNEPIETTAPMIYTEKSKGVLAETDIRTDRNELALDAIDKYEKSVIARSNEPEASGQADGEKSE